MTQYITGKAGFIKLLTVVLATSLFTVFSCTDEFEKTDKSHNLSMSLSTRAGETAAELIPNMRLFTFNNDGTANDKKFRQEILNMTRTADKITAQVETGTWHMAMVSTPNGGTIISPTKADEMSRLPMYKYEPTITAGRSSSAHEIFLENKLTPDITSGGTHSMNAQLNRTVAKVELIIRKTTPNFILSGDHVIKLCNIPSTISYTGDLLPNSLSPDTLSTGLQAPVVLQAAGDGFYKGTETITFIIPAHRGDAYTSADPTDVIGLKMGVALTLERVGGSKFIKYAEIPVVAQCNKILRVSIDVNDGLEFKTEILPWEGVEIGSIVGKGYQNWLYVNKGATGNGLSWSDALPDINTAVAKAGALISAGKTVNGILVAGGPNRIYGEGLNVPANMKIYGGWTGQAGTELAANDVEGPYTVGTGARNLSIKSVIMLGNNSVQLANANSVLDGFIIQGAAAGNSSVVTVSNPTAWINAVEIKNNLNTSGTALTVTGANTTATNILVSNNTRGVSVGAGAKLVNATIVKNSAASTFTGSLLNSVYWGNTGAPTITGTVNYCAFNGDNNSMPAGTNYPMHESVNNSWFTEQSSIPGPHFKLVTSDFRALNSKAPMLGRGDENTFTTAVSGKMPAGCEKDINGNPRSYEGIDAGCYEDAGFKGFKFQWNMTDVYISTKLLIESDHPALLFDNSEGAYVKWRIEATPIGNLFTMVSGGAGGAGTGTTLGYFKLKSGPTANTGNIDKLCGTIKFISDNMGSYLPDETKNVYQTPGTSKVWNDGYAGSFHRWNETEPRYIAGPNSGVWTARIVSGHEWIKIDGKARPANPNNDTEVEETFGGVVSGTGNIIFRVGMKSTLASKNSQPRYGLISITRTVSGQTGNALFFVRQGEAADYLYGPDDVRPLSSDGKRPYAKKFTVYNMTDGNGGFNDSGVELNKRGGSFVDYPSKQGYYFKFNDTKAYYPDNTKSGTNIGNTYHTGAWSVDREICPDGYHTPTEPELTYSYFLNRPLYHFSAGNNDGTTFVWGRLADGYFDKYAAMNAETYGTGPDLARKGLLMYNDYNNASIFFPTANRRDAATLANPATAIAWYWTSSTRRGTLSSPNRTDPYGITEDQGWATHSYNNHLGISCTDMKRRHAGSVRCVEGNERTAPASPPHP